MGVHDHGAPMRPSLAAALLCGLVGLGCQSEPGTSHGGAAPPPPTSPPPSASSPEGPARVRAAAAELPATPTGPLRWTTRLVLPAPHRQPSYLLPTPSGLVVTASIDALGVDGAAVFRVEHGAARRLFEWQGQGFLRAHWIDDRIVVPDADAPFGLDAIVQLDLDGYVFILDAADVPAAAQRESLPAVYHVFDVAVVDGRMVASTGAYVPGDLPYRSSRAPAALFVRGDTGRPWTRVLETPQVPAGTDTPVTRFTYLLSLDRGGLLAGLSHWDAAEVVRIDGLPDAPRMHVASGVAGETVRWERWGDRIVHLGLEGLAISHDGGRRFAPLVTPAVPHGVLATKDALLVLCEGALFATGDGVEFRELAARDLALDVPLTPLLHVPMAVQDGRLWAANPVTGALLEAVAGAS